MGLVFQHTPLVSFNSLGFFRQVCKTMQVSHISSVDSTPYFKFPKGDQSKYLLYLKLQDRRDKVFALPQTVLDSSALTIQNNLGSLLQLFLRNTSKIKPIMRQMWKQNIHVVTIISKKIIPMSSH